MANYGDFNFGDDAPGPDTDPVNDNNFPDNKSSSDGIQNDVANYPEPGESDTFKDGDPTLFSVYGNPEEPGAQQDHSSPIISDDTKPNSIRKKGIYAQLDRWRTQLEEETEETRRVNNAFLERAAAGEARAKTRRENSFFSRLTREKIVPEYEQPLIASLSPKWHKRLYGSPRIQESEDPQDTPENAEIDSKKSRRARVQEEEPVSESVEYFDQSTRAILTRLYGSSFATDRVAGVYKAKDAVPGSKIIFDESTYSDIPENDDFWGSNTRAYKIPTIEPFEKRASPSDIDELQESDDIVNTQFDNIALAGFDEDLQPDYNLEDFEGLAELEASGSYDLSNYIDDTTNNSQLIEFQNPFGIEDYYGLL